MASLMRWIAAAAAAAAIAGCGGGSGAGAQGGDASGGSGGATGATSMALTTSAPTVGTDGKTVATITAYVKDGSNRALANQTVDFSTTDGGVILLPAATPAITAKDGSVTAKLTVTDRSNRDVTVNVRTGSIAQAVTIAVVGTTVSLDGPATLVANVPTEFTVALRDSAGEVIGGKPVTMSSSAGNIVGETTKSTDSTGRAKFVVTGVNSGADTLTVAAMGAVSSLETEVAATQLVFSAPALDQELVVESDHTVSVAFLVQGVPQSGQTVEFLATRGTITATAQTDAAGVATATLSALTAGSSTITAKVGDVLSFRRVEFVSRTPSKISVQSSPANVGVNLSTATANSSQLIAVVRDANDNPVKGQMVSFSSDVDPSNGRIEPAIATTDSAGVATVAFFPGPNTTGNNQIVIRATVTGQGVTETTTLTASRQELIVRIGTGNKLLVPDEVNYISPWDAVVTDSSGNPVANAGVQASLVGVAFYKGRYYEGDTTWVPGGEFDGTPRHKCAGEDEPPNGNGNLRLDAGEDTNGDGQITPGNVAAAQVVAEGGRTDPTGFARIHVKYPKQFANWAQVRLIVTITAIAGTEGTAVSVFDLAAVRDDLKKENDPPGGIRSAFGVLADCTTAN